MKKLNIAVVCVGFPIGSETFILNQIVEYIKQGHTVDIFPYKIWENDVVHQNVINYRLMERVTPAIMHDHNYIKRLLSAIIFWSQNPKGTPIFLRCLNPILFGKKALNFKKFFDARQFVEKPFYDLYLAHFGENGVNLAELRQTGLIKGKLLTYFHGYDLNFTDSNLAKRQKFYSNLFQKGDFFVTNSTYSFKAMIELGAPAERSAVIPVGLEVERYLLSKRCYDKQILHLITVGRLIPLKGHIFGIKLVAKLVERGIKNIRYTIVGEGIEYEKLLNFRNRLFLQKYIEFPGNASQERVIQYLSEADIYIHTSITNEEGRQEAQGLVIQEAQAAGLPVVAFNTGGVSDGIEDGVTGYLFQEKDISSMANLVQKLISSPSERQIIGERASKFVEKTYSINLLNNRILQAVKLI